jgi:predicted nucleotidyltransferase component of viral defense system
MAKIDFYKINKSEKGAIFSEIATQKGMKPFAVEKDWWVSRSLETIFQMPIAKHLVFKGGTSLSKAWKLINRFSEDIDLAIDSDFFFKSEKGWTRDEITRLRKAAGKYSTGAFFEDLKIELLKKGFKHLEFKVVDNGDSDQDPRILEIHYQNVIKPESEYLLPKVQIEVSCRSLREPFSVRSFGALVDEFYADKDFAEPLFEVPTVNSERTFLEKLFLLHEEFHRPLEKMRVDRLSRHLYDIYHLTKAGVGEKAINDKDLYETIVAHRYKFSRIGAVNYNLHNPKTLNPIPPGNAIVEWEADYTKMTEDMIYEENKPSFEDLINNLMEIMKQLKAVEWNFELEFAKPITKY